MEEPTYLGAEAPTGTSERDVVEFRVSESVTASLAKAAQRLGVTVSTAQGTWGMLLGQLTGREDSRSERRWPGGLLTFPVSRPWSVC